MKKKIYLGMTLDLLHAGHINIINQARVYGDIIVGLNTDKSIADFKRIPLMTYEDRKKIAENIKGVIKVVPQKEWDYSNNLLKYKPDYLIHGDDWKEGEYSKYRTLAIKALSSYGGKLIEIPYTKGVSITKLSTPFLKNISPDIRKSTLRRLLNSKSIIRILEVHNPISAIIAENANIKEGLKLKEFDGFWSSSLSDSTVMGKPDIEILDLTTRLNNINKIFDVTSKPLIFDADTGGKIEHLELHIKNIERLGISAIIIEDKVGLKKNSLFGNTVIQKQDSIKNFSLKLKVAQKSKSTDDFMVIARIESLILEKGISDALKRARSYIKSGADGIMIHSNKKSPSEIFAFSKAFRTEFTDIPLVCVPTSYNKTKESELIKNGFNIVIYANHMIRSAYPAMNKVAHEILRNERSLESDKSLISINEILNLIPGTK